MSEERGTNLLDTGSPFYDVYETADGEWVSIGSIEPQFYAELLELTGVQHDDLPAPDGPRRMAGAARTAHRGRSRAKTRAEWTELLEGTDVCFAPVLPMSEARAHPHVVARRIDRRARRHGSARARTALLAHRGRDPGPGAVAR